MRIVFSGVIGRLPVGGHAWIAMQYLAGMRSLGHDVLFQEDCGDGSWVYNWDTEQVTESLDYPADYVRRCLAAIGLEDCWCYRAGDAHRGLSPSVVRDFCNSADLLLLWAVPMKVWRPEYDLPRRRAYIDADPGFTQISLVTGHAELADTVGRCEQLFTIAQRLGAPDCPIPDAGRRWIKTVSPVAIALWPAVADAVPPTHFTSVMQWRGFREVRYEGITYGQKDQEFPKFFDLPQCTRQPLRLAATGPAPEDLTRFGWELLPGWIPSRTPESYQKFIQQSRAEFGVAKHGYVQMRGGWFSDRTACYLASGRPALLEDTGLSDWLPTGEGVVTFRDLPGAVAGIDAINADYPRHRRAARHLAESRFSTDKVLPPLLEAATD